MPRATKAKARTSREPRTRRTRRTGEEARSQILDAAEKRLVEGGPAGIRLQEVASDVGVSHPAVLHHFGSREALVEAVVARALDSLNQSIVAAIGTEEPDPDRVAYFLGRVSSALVKEGHARAFLWLALSGYEPAVNERIRRLAEVVHEQRRQKRAASAPPRPMPPFEDTYFTMLLPALALMTLSVIDGSDDDKPLGPRRFRAWLGRLMHHHLETNEA